MSELRTIVAEYAEARRLRLDVERTVKELKAREDGLRVSILNEMSSMGAKTVNLPEIGKVTVKETARYEISDVESFLLHNIDQMVGHAQQGHPLADGLSLQRRPSNSAVDSYLESFAEEDWDAVLSKIGLRRATENTLSFTGAKI